jgi:hypothetical protein
MSQYSWRGTDLDNIFELRVGEIGTLVDYRDVGWDLGDRYSTLTAATVEDGNIGTRVPLLQDYNNQGVDFSAIFVGNPSQYTVSTLGTVSGGGSAQGPGLYMLSWVLSFSSAQALTDYFTFGGRFIISASLQGGSTIEDEIIRVAWETMGSLIIYDQGCYLTGAGGTLETGTGGLAIGTTPIELYSLPLNAPYSASTFRIYVSANNNAGLATTITIQVQLDLSEPDTSLMGTRYLDLQQRNYAGVVPPTQDVPVYNLASNNWNTGI